MKNRVKKKLRSQKGASITFALLLFLVCAVLCSVILMAATTSSGRMAKMAETDQRYYAVTSAAELLKNQFKEHPTVSIVNIKQTETTTTYTNGTASTAAGTPVVTEYIVADKTATEILESDYKEDNKLTESAAQDTIQKDAAKSFYYNTGTLPQRTLTLSSEFYEGAGLDYDALTVEILERMEADGKIVLTMYNKYKGKDTPSTNGSRYKLELSFGADQSVSKDTKTKNISTTAISDTSYKVTEETTEITTTTWTWSLNGLKTIS